MHIDRLVNAGVRAGSAPLSKDIAGVASGTPTAHGGGSLPVNLSGSGAADGANAGVAALDPDWFRNAVVLEIVPKSFKDTTGSGHEPAGVD